MVMPDEVLVQSVLLDALGAYCFGQRPIEACGILMGKQRIEDGVQRIQIEQFLPVANIACSPERTFELDPGAWVNHMADSLLRHQTVGVFHSHPCSPPVPSREDLMGLWEFPAYLIVSLADNVPQAKSYQLAAGRYREQRLIIHNG